MKFKILLVGIFIFAVVSGAVAFEIKSYEYVWMPDVLHPERGCTIQVHNLTLEPNLESVMVTFASDLNTSTCELKTVYTGQHY